MLPASPRARNNSADNSPKRSQAAQQSMANFAEDPAAAAAAAPDGTTSAYNSPVRSRANTAPTPEGGAASPAIAATSDASPKVKATSPKSPSSPGQKSRKVSSDDEELRQATAMAIAIQSNPNMSTEEIQKLVQQQQPGAATSKTGEAAASSSSPGSIPLFSSAPAMPSSSSNHNNNNKKTRPFGFDGSRLKAMARAAVSGPAREGEELPAPTDVALAAPAATTTTSSSSEREKMDKEKNRLFDGHRIKAAFHREQHNNSKDNLAAAESEDSALTGVTGPSRRLLLRATKPGRTPPPSPLKGGEASSTAKPIASMAAGGGGGGAEASTVAPTMTYMQKAFQSAIAPKQVPRPSTAPIRLTAIAWKRRGGMGKFAQSGSAWERRRIELQGTSLFYYAKDETDGPDEDGDDAAAVANPEGGAISSTSDKTDSASTLTGAQNSSSLQGEDVGEGVVVTKQSTWFETAFSVPEDPNAPRGHLDLAKEKASCHAALGNHGAPSPFAISIKVRGETKWKLCFDHHKTQMEWLAALTDVVVQNSVDVYNAQLVEAAESAANANQAEGAVATTSTTLTALLGSATTPSSQAKSPPPAGFADNGEGGQRLWQMQSYTISSPTAGGGDDDDDDDDDLGSNVGGDDDEETDYQHLTAEQHKEAQMVATEESEQTWMIPEDRFMYFFVIVNAALALARTSSMSLPGFWYLVVFANASLYYFCMVQAPSWKSIVDDYVRASPESSSSSRKKGKDSSKVKTGDTTVGGSKSKSASSSGYRPIAGSSTMNIKNPTDLPVNEKNEVFAGWRCPSADMLAVRSHGYLTTKKKVPSPGELYDCIQCDIFEAPSRYPDMAPRVQLPEIKFDDGNDATPKTWRTPDLFVISIALPTDPPKLGRTSGDGGGYTITMYLKMKQETREILRRVTAEGYDPSKEEYGDDEDAIQKSKVNAVRLLEEWVRRAPTDQKWFSRFKCVPNAHNLREIGMPGWISKYNGKPFLIKRPGVTGFIHQHPELSVFEFDISLHPFPYLARQGICFLKENFFKKVLVSFGFVIEGRADDELPECILGVLQLCYPDPAHGIQAKDFFGGTAPKSF